MNKIIIHLICPDQEGIIAQLTSILYDNKINILSWVDEDLESRLARRHMTWTPVKEYKL